jgi:DNA-binding NarL/FixJ family response regulator
MRFLLVGSPAGRARLRAGLGPSAEILGEYGSLAEARAADLDADAIVLASSGRAERAAFAEPLTAREVQVLELLAEGLPNKTIAARLGISDQTVKFHVASIYGKLGASNRTDAVRKAVGRGLVTL